VYLKEDVMATDFQELMDLKDKASREGVTMAELGHRGGVVTQTRRIRKKENEERFTRLKDAGALWWLD
jgi:hypothetical protein